ncbi:hypothetical protein TWF481_008320 [Arthrobotrys musiformis]|uniref:Uncharacterized protein n=1 Tax=Arthrobotrys musiformis TaxID=47236 RepID=A0AAV9WCJ8_9PEZI
MPPCTPPPELWGIDQGLGYRSRNSAQQSIRNSTSMKRRLEDSLTQTFIDAIENAIRSAVHNSMVEAVDRHLKPMLSETFAKHGHTRPISTEHHFAHADSLEHFRSHNVELDDTGALWIPPCIEGTKVLTLIPNKAAITQLSVGNPLLILGYNRGGLYDCPESSRAPVGREIRDAKDQDQSLLVRQVIPEGME